MKITIKSIKAEAAKTPSGPPPIPIKISTLYLLSVTNKAPETSPSVINFNLTLSFFNSFIIVLCLGRSKIQAVKFSGFLFLNSAKF